MDRAGRVVVLNGTASAGKTSIAREFRDLAPTMWVGMSQDAVSENLIDRWIHVAAEDDDRRCAGFTFVRRSNGLMHVEVGEIGIRLLRGYRMAVGAMARAGNDVIVDEAMFDTAGGAEWTTALDGLAVTWVRVDCDLAVCELRERSRSDRHLIQGLARGLHGQVHEHVDYDLEIDTTRSTPAACARAVLDFVESR